MNQRRYAKKFNRRHNRGYFDISLLEEVFQFPKFAKLRFNARPLNLLLIGASVSAASCLPGHGY